MGTSRSRIALPTPFVLVVGTSDLPRIVPARRNVFAVSSSLLRAKLLQWIALCWALPHSSFLECIEEGPWIVLASTWQQYPDSLIEFVKIPFGHLSSKDGFLSSYRSLQHFKCQDHSLMLLRLNSAEHTQPFHSSMCYSSEENDRLPLSLRARKLSTERDGLLFPISAG